MKVVDASVVLQWLLSEPSTGSKEILEAHLSGSELLIAPELLNYEVGNVLVTKVRLKSDDALELFIHFLNLGIETYSLGTDEYRAGLELAHRYRLTLYDVCYLALALALDVRLVTGDRKLATRAAPLKLIETI